MGVIAQPSRAFVSRAPRTPFPPPWNAPVPRGARAGRGGHAAASQTPGRGNMERPGRDELNEEQRGCVLPAGNLAIVAGPGVGKTRTILERAIYLAKNGFSVRLVAFTRKAKEEMAERLKRLPDNSSIKVSTFDSFCRSISRCQKIAETDDEDSSSLFPTYRKQAACIIASGEAPQDIIPDHIIVDEAQDLSQDLWSVIDKLRERNVFVTAVGDPLQSIFSVHGAKPEMFESFTCKVERRVLTRSYRSDKFLLAPLNSIRRDEGLDEILPSRPASEGNRPTLRRLQDDGEDRQELTSLCRRWLALRRSVAVLVRSNEEGFQAAEWLSPVPVLNLCRETNRSVSEEGHAHAKAGLEKDDGMVEVCTVHNAKGLEWDCVVVYNLYDRGDRFEKDEGVRLVYVALSRARHELLILYRPSEKGRLCRHICPLLKNGCILDEKKLIVDHDWKETHERDNEETRASTMRDVAREFCGVMVNNDEWTTTNLTSTKDMEGPSPLVRDHARKLDLACFGGKCVETIVYGSLFTRDDFVEKCLESVYQLPVTKNLFEAWACADEARLLKLLEEWQGFEEKDSDDWAVVAKRQREDVIHDGRRIAARDEIVKLLGSAGSSVPGAIVPESKFQNDEIEARWRLGLGTNARPIRRFSWPRDAVWTVPEYKRRLGDLLEKARRSDDAVITTLLRVWLDARSARGNDKVYVAHFLQNQDSPAYIGIEDLQITDEMRRRLEIDTRELQRLLPKGEPGRWSHCSLEFQAGGKEYTIRGEIDTTIGDDALLEIKATREVRDEDKSQVVLYGLVRAAYTRRDQKCYVYDTRNGQLHDTTVKAAEAMPRLERICRTLYKRSTGNSPQLVSGVKACVDTHPEAPGSAHGEKDEGAPVKRPRVAARRGMSGLP